MTSIEIELSRVNRALRLISGSNLTLVQLGDEGTVFRVTVCGEPVEGVDRRESGVSCRDAVGALGFEVLKKPSDQRRVEVDEIELGGFPAGSVLGVA